MPGVSFSKNGLFKSIFHASHQNMKLSELFKGLEYFMTRGYIRSYEVTRRGLNELVNDVSKKQIKDVDLNDIDFNPVNRSSFKFERSETVHIKDQKVIEGYDDYSERVIFESDEEDPYA